MAQINDNQRGWRILTIILSAVIIAACAWFICRQLMKDRPEKPTVTTFSVAADTGMDKEILMIDGTRIWIRSGSRINYPSTFAHRRTVTLAGTAMFGVAGSTQTPFRVIAGEIAIEADDAEFQVVGDDTAGNIRVIPNTGEVRVSVGDGAVHSLKRGEQLTLHDGGVTVEDLPSGKLSEWRTEKLNFRLMTLAEIFDSLSALYNIPFEFDRAHYGGDRFSIELNGSEELAEVLAIVSTISGKFDYAIESGVKVRIYSKK